MNEHLLQYLWNFKIFKRLDFKDTEGHEVEILDFGQWNKNAGPDFLYAKIRYQGLILAGHIELHLKSSDFRKHQHEGDKHYNNLILHAVYEHDENLPSLQEKNIPTLELQPYIDEFTIVKHLALQNTKPNFIPCDAIFDKTKTPLLFTEQLLLEKLEQRSNIITQDLEQLKSNYEALLFQNLAYAFGLRINADIFKQLAGLVDFSIINKVSQHREQLEALFYGLCGWLDQPSDTTTTHWKREFDFLNAKYNLPQQRLSPLFLRLRPANFPTIRLSQLAHLYHLHQNLFSKIVKAEHLSNIISLFQPVVASHYWDTHYNFGKTTAKSQPKRLTKSFIHLIIINAVLPLKYTYYKNQKESTAEDILRFYEALPPEHNSIITQWKALGVDINSAKDTQAYLFLYKQLCSAKKCLNCGIGYQLLKP